MKPKFLLIEGIEHLESWRFFVPTYTKARWCVLHSKIKYYNGCIIINPRAGVLPVLLLIRAKRHQSLYSKAFGLDRVLLESSTLY